MKKVIVLCSMIIALGFVGCTPKAAPKKADDTKKPAATAGTEKPAETPAEKPAEKPAENK